MSEEIQRYKSYLLGKYKEIGGNKDISSFTLDMMQNEIDNQERMNRLTSELEQARKNAEGALNNDPKEKTKFRMLSVDQAKQNQALAREAAATLRSYLDYFDPMWDPRSLEDERFKRDNQLIKFESEVDKGAVVILRDEFGRCDV